MLVLWNRIAQTTGTPPITWGVSSDYLDYYELKERGVIKETATNMEETVVAAREIGRSSIRHNR